MTLRFEIFGRESTNWQEGNWLVSLGYIYNCAESSDVTTCMWIQLCKDIQEYTEVTLGNMVGYLLVLNHIWCS